jgi:hypothetical protein
MHTPPAHLRLFRHLVRPARGGAAAVVIVFALLLFIASNAGLIGIPLALVVISWFFKYAYILFDHTAWGFDEPPTLDIQMMNPVDEQRPLAQILILGLIYAAVKLADVYLGPITAGIVAVSLALLAPASVAVLGLEGHLLKAANPLEWIRMVRGLGPLYWLVLAVIALYALALTLLGRLDLWMPVETAIGMFAVLSVFSFLGGALYERRHELGMETRVSPERTEEKRLKQEVRQSENIVTDAYGLMRVSSHVKCWDLLKNWLDSRGNAPEDYRWLCERVAKWEDPRYITRLSEDYVDRLLMLKRTGEALDVVARRVSLDQRFRPKSAAATLSIAQMAVRGGGTPRVARILLADFAARFPDDPQVAAAEALARHLGADMH